MSVQVEKWIVNVDTYYKMAETGILSANDRVELIEGEIIKRSPIGSRHVACVDRLNILLNRRINAALTTDQTVIVRIQNPIRLDPYSEPEPDVALLKFRDDFYARSHPTAEDILLIIEVVDTSLEYDRSVKLPLYAQAGIPEVWLVDLLGERVEAHAEPVGRVYQNVRHGCRGDALVLRAFSDLTLGVWEIL